MGNVSKHTIDQNCSTTLPLPIKKSSASPLIGPINVKFTKMIPKTIDMEEDLLTVH